MSVRLIEKNPTQIELGCGNRKLSGFYVFDVNPDSQADCIIDFEHDRLPLLDNSVYHVNSSHAMEHLSADAFILTLQEIIRVCKHNVWVEILIPYGKSNDAWMPRHRIFLPRISGMALPGVMNGFT